MSTPPDMADRHARILARLTELGLALAERTFEDAQAAETPAERIEAVKAFHAVSRSVRQCVALEARLVRQQALDAREAERAQVAPRKPGGAEISKRITAVRDAVTRVIWHEAEDDDTAAWLEEGLDEDIALGCHRDDFCAEPLDDHIARLCLAMGLPEEAALNWRDLPAPPEPEDPGAADDDNPPDATISPPPDAATTEPPPQSSA